MFAYCTICLAFYREKNGSLWGSRPKDRVVESGCCFKCPGRHTEIVDKLKAELASLQLKRELEKKSHEIDLDDLKNLKADNNAHLSKIEFLKIRRDCNHGDVIIAASDSRILAHRTILAERSPVFQKLLQSECSETQTKKKSLVKLDCLSAPLLEAMVDFCYSGEIAFSELVPPREVLKVAHTFQLGFLSELTEAELCRGLSVDNVPQMLILARDCSALRLQEEAGKLFKEHFDILSSKVYEALQGELSTEERWTKLGKMTGTVSFFSQFQAVYYSQGREGLERRTVGVGLQSPL